MSIDCVNTKTHTARKKHRCELCGGVIDIGQRYNADFCVDGGYAYTFKSHIECSDLVDELIDYCEFDDGVDRMSFCDGCSEVSEIFVCPDCEKHENCQKSFCIDKMHKFFSRYELYVAEREGNSKVWKVREKKTPF